MNRKINEQNREKSSYEYGLLIFDKSDASN